MCKGARAAAQPLVVGVSVVAQLSISADHVREALEHLYESVPLASCALAQALPDVASIPDVRARAQKLRGLLLDAIELLRPAREARFGSRASRSYDVLNLRYVEGLSVALVAQELDLSERQAYRDLQRAHEELLAILRSYVPGLTHAATPPAAAGQADPLAQELERLVPRPKNLDLAALLRSALEAVAPLVQRLGACVSCDVEEKLPPVSADEGILRQIVIQMLSLAIQASAAVIVRLCALPRRALRLSLEFCEERQPVRQAPLEALTQLAVRQGLQLSVGREGKDVRLCLQVPAVEPHLVLVVEDNEGAIELYRRYLSQSAEWQLVGATDPRAVYDMATHLRPAAIILDIMMPRLDGWSVLQLLRAQPATARIPVIVCSVFDDPELAAVLGARVFLKKPISQFELLAALRRCLEEL